MAQFAANAKKWKHQHGGKVGVPSVKKMPDIQGKGQLQEAANPLLNTGIIPSVKPAEPKQVITDTGDKEVNFDQQVAATSSAQDPSGGQQPQQGISPMNDIMSMINSALGNAPKQQVQQAIVDPSQLPTFKDGGVMNVIVDGHFHAHKHGMDDLPEFEDATITSKGVPVVTMGEGGEVTQHAEVEKNELILHHDLTKQLEKLMKDGTEESMIEAGKILSREIVKNTKDSKDKILKTA
jgi:hypothetical protein